MYKFMYSQNDILFFTSNVNENGRVEITKTMIYGSNSLFGRLFLPGFTVQSIVSLITQVDLLLLYLALLCK